MDSHCIFCRIISRRSPGTIVHEDSSVVVIEDAAPQAPHHYLIIPREHIPTVMELHQGRAGLVDHIFKVAATVARQRDFSEQGFRIVTNCNMDGGQTVWHLHFHLLAGRRFSWPPG